MQRLRLLGSSGSVGLPYPNLRPVSDALHPIPSFLSAGDLVFTNCSAQENGGAVRLEGDFVQSGKSSFQASGAWRALNLAKLLGCLGCLSSASNLSFGRLMSLLPASSICLEVGLFSLPFVLPALAGGNVSFHNCSAKLGGALHTQAGAVHSQGHEHICECGKDRKPFPGSGPEPTIGACRFLGWQS